MPRLASITSQQLTGIIPKSVVNLSVVNLLYTLDNPNAFGQSDADEFGWAVSIDGDRAIVGVPDEEDADGSGSGKAYIFDVTTGNLLHTLDNPNAYDTGAFDSFGYDVAISGNYAIVGTPNEDDSVFGSSSGKAYIFDVTSGNLLYTLDNPNAYNTSVADNFGDSVAISGDRVIVGAYGEDDANGSGSGKAYIYDITTFTTPTISSATYVLDNPNAFATATNDFFGLQVAISGDRAIVGTQGEDDAGGIGSGKAYIFDVTTGALIHTLDNPNAFDTSESDQFGASVAISGNRAIVGAPGEDDASINSSGKAYIFDVVSGNLVHTLDNPNAFGTSTSDQFGRRVSISGNRVIVGVPQEDDAEGTSSGKAYIFDVTTGNLLNTLDNPNVRDTSASDLFGSAVAISGNYIIVGAYGEDQISFENSGNAYIFELS